MPSQPLHSPSAAAKLISRPPHGHAVNVHTLRRWCALHADHLSDGANPNRNKDEATPPASRWLTDRDVEVLRTVAQLRAEGMGTDEINAKLATLSFAVLALEDDKVDHPLSDNVDNPIIEPPTPSQTPQDAPDGAQMLPVVLSGMNERFEAIERRFEAMERHESQRVNAFVTGALVGAGIVLAVVALVLALGQ